MTAEVNYYLVSDEDLVLRRDPAFYVNDEQAHELVAVITSGVPNDAREIRVYCDGEMRIHVWKSKKAREANETLDDVIRYVSDLVSIANTDKELNDLEERIEWVNNAWFDLYAYGDGIADGDGWLNCVHYDIQEAVAQAVALMDDEEVWKELTT